MPYLESRAHLCSSFNLPVGGILVIPVRGLETPNGTYLLNYLPGHGFEIDADAVARVHERWQRDGPYNTIESVR